MQGTCSVLLPSLAVALVAALLVPTAAGRYSALDAFLRTHYPSTTPAATTTRGSHDDETSAASFHHTDSFEDEDDYKLQASGEDDEDDDKEEEEADADADADAEAEDEEDYQTDDEQALADDYGTSRTSDRTVSSYTQQKWRELGSRRGVDDAFKKTNFGYRPNPEYDVQQAVSNALRVKKEHECRWPKPRLVKVKDVYPHPNKRYIPHCALLHQCGDDTGCCQSDSLTCTAAKSQPIHLYFYTTTMFSDATVEKLKFYNHTECRCEDRLDMVMPRDMAYEKRLPEKKNHNGPACKCPSHFDVRRLHGGAVCRCECFERDPDCLRLSKGKEYFSHRDRVCIHSGHCELPTCEFGTYLRKAGRCTRKKERLNTWQHRLYHTL